MKDVIRVVLVDPNEESREAFRRLLGGMSVIWLTEVFTSYQNLGVRVKEIGAHLTIVTLDHDPDQAIELIQAMSQADPNVVILPASQTSDSTLILRAIRAGAREFLTLPTEPRELLETINRMMRGRLNFPHRPKTARKSSRSRVLPAGLGAQRSPSTWRRPWPPTRSKRSFCSISISCLDRSTLVSTLSLTTR